MSLKYYIPLISFTSTLIFTVIQNGYHNFIFYSWIESPVPPAAKIVEISSEPETASTASANSTSQQKTGTANSGPSVGTEVSDPQPQSNPSPEDSKPGTSKPSKTEEEDPELVA